MPTSRTTSAAARGAGHDASGAAHSNKAATATSAHNNSSSSDMAEVYTPSSLLTISPEHRQQLRSAFDLFDRDGVGRIPAHDVKVALYALGYDVSDAQLRQLLRDVGVTNAVAADTTAVTMDFTDFYNVLLRQMTRKESRVEVVRAFKMMDSDMKGHLALDDLRRLSRALHAELSDEELLEMLHFAHYTSSTGGGGASTGDGDAAKDTPVVDEDDFLRLMKLANVY